MKKIIVNCPAKIHLLGEHSVVYGKPALLAAINKNITATLVPSSKKQIIIKNFDGDLTEFQEIIEQKIKKTYKVKNISPYKIEITSDVPFGMGLGSSAALSAVVTATILLFIKKDFDNKMLFQIAYEGERYFHGNPSGGDLATVIAGGLLYYRKEFEFLKTFSVLPFSVPKSVDNFFMIDSGKSTESTREMVEKVGKFVKQYPEKAGDLFNNQEKLTQQVVIALKEGNEKEIISCITKGERNLEQLGVVGEKIKRIIQDIEKSGGAAKISGGGGYKTGGGILLCYHPNPKKLLLLMKQKNVPIEKISIEEKGITYEPNK